MTTSLVTGSGSRSGHWSAAGLDVIEELGRGAHASVYRARRGDRDYAVKVLRADVVDRGAATAAFRREAALLACVDHPSVSRVHDVGEVDGDPFLVMELVTGRPLAAVLDSGRMPLVEVVRVGAELAGALAAAHRVGVVHRDVTPHNIIVLADGSPKLIDFGLAAQQDTGTGSDQVAGTFAYAAPEQTGMLARPVDGRADLYALGVVLFECLAGRLPFESADVGELVRLHAAAPPPDVRALRPEVPAGLAAVVSRLLAKDPDDRYADGDELAAVLNGLVDAPAERRRVEGTGGRLVGRDAELATLSRLWAQARGGAGTAVRLTGVAGVGKTKIAGELARRSRGAGHPVLTLLCTPDAPSMAPLRAALERYLCNLDRLPDSAAEAARQRIRAAAGPAAALLQLLTPALRGVLNAPDLPDEDRQEQLVTAAAAFLAELARAEGGLIVHVDDAQWLDEATARVFTSLTTVLPTCPMLIVTTERTGDGDCWAAALGSSTVEVPALGDTELATLAAHQLGNAAVPAHLVDQLVARSQGNPFAALQYLHAMLDAGVLVPHWGSWVLDEQAFDRLALPTDVLDVVVARARTLSGTSRELLIAAAAVGAPFAAELLADVCGTTLPAALTAVQDGVARAVLEPAGGGRFAFLHQRLREALLADLDGERRRELHQRIAECLSAGEPADPREWYRIARHYAAGQVGRTPQLMLAACRSAAHAALGAHAPAQALEFLDLAERTAGDAGLPLDHTFHRQRGLAYLRSGKFTDAEQELHAALSAEADPVRRADLYAHIARAQISDFASDEAIDSVRAGLRELGRPLPASPLLIVLYGLGHFLLGLVRARTRRRASTADGYERERFRLEAELCDAGSMGAAVGMNMGLALGFHLRAFPAVVRLGSGPEYARLQASYGMVAGAARLSGLSERCYARADAAARAVGDPRLTTRVPWTRATLADAVAGFGPTTGNALREVLREHGQWLPLDEYVTSTGGLGAALLLRGYTGEAQTWYERARQRTAAAPIVPGNPLAMFGVQLAAATGDPAEARERLAAMTATGSERHDNLGRLLNILLAQASLAAAAPGLEDVDAIAAEVARRRITPRKVWRQQRHLWLYLAWARLAACRSADEAGRERRLAQARDAVRALGRAADTDVLRAFHHAARAEYLELAGKPREALRDLARADLLGQRLDLPLLGFLVAAGRSRVLTVLGDLADADRQADHAVTLATQYGWEHRAREARALLKSSSSTRASRVVAHDGGQLVRRRLAALQQLSAAATTVLDPDTLARIALDETIRTFAAERAILFLLDQDTGRLEPHLGRGAEGTDLGELRGYSASLVGQVLASGTAMVVASADDGAALGSRSVVANGLRSVMIAPMRLGGDVIGVVYLDTRLVKGAFTGDDADILAAMAQQVASALVTARAAQLEVTVRTVERQRSLAETMRAAAAEVSGTLVPEDVLDRLLTTFIRVTGADSGVLLPIGDTAMPAERSSAPGALPAFTALDTARRGTAGGLWGDLDVVLTGARAWVAAPLTGRDGPVAVAVLVATDANRFDDSHVSILAALAGQGMVAYENARLFTQVQRLATTDALTGLHNRRYFFDVANERVSRALRDRLPLVAMMMDIDHFKRINDGHGHGTGDDVIQQVTARIRAAAPPHAIVGRYGGEEFALVLPGADRSAADELGETLRRAIADDPVTTRTGDLAVTVSVGIAALTPADAALDDVLGHADQALYQAKQDGRNRVARF
ncbi:diguanylate cyclase (GGDEF)-like protein [Actinoplanes octamycinicus]|uniref:Diguanylate cyclase (GGDEF)-like protein n=1 Tax=Actinoplanes octamycinicus TaxID=135948 RepID=A0A7W7MAH9_9ACTN|nr:diguanylate cyclase [Actinoplanes octamycinicus]MBB4743012.1 diguanylate cyclase (GGDEF)-like protein [Actinoplanes octamycinicus]GIE58133.1 hypothetical protein Aoc01nite_35350 [Actinoplanes octamycinicus]